MQITIEIPEEEYRIAKYGQYGNINVDIIRNAIKNGTPLPKGHGRLIDADELKGCRHMIDTMYCEYDEVVNVEDIDDAPTIIEADAEREE